MKTINQTTIGSLTLSHVTSSNIRVYITTQDMVSNLPSLISHLTAYIKNLSPIMFSVSFGSLKDLDELVSEEEHVIVGFTSATKTCNELNQLTKMFNHFLTSSLKHTSANRLPVFRLTFIN